MLRRRWVTHFITHSFMTSNLDSVPCIDSVISPCVSGLFNHSPWQTSLLFAYAYRTLAILTHHTGLISSVIVVIEGLTETLEPEDSIIWWSWHERIKLHQPPRTLRHLPICLTAWGVMTVATYIPRKFNLSIEFNEIPVLIPISISKLHLWYSLARI